MPCQLLFDALDLPVQSLTNPACTVVIDHAGVVKRLQHFLADDLVDLSVCNMRSVNPTNLAAFADREMNVFLRPPPFGQNKPPLLRCVGKQMPLKVLRALLPAYTVAACCCSSATAATRPPPQELTEIILLRVSKSPLTLKRKRKRLCFPMRSIF